MRINLVFHIFLLLTLAQPSALWASSSWSLRKGPWACRAPLTTVVDLERMPVSPFFSPDDPLLLEYPSYQALLKAYREAGPDRLRDVIEHMASQVGYKVEPVPIVVRPEVATQLFAAAEQAARADAALLEDLHRSTPRILERYPEYKGIVSSSPLFAAEIQGTPAATQAPWNVNVATDVIVANNSDGTFAIRIQERDTGSIGGSFRLIDDILGKAWNVDLSRDFVSVKQSLIDRVKRHVEAARSVPLPGGKKGISVLYTEDDPPLHEGNEVYSLVTGLGVRVVSRYNKDLLSWNERTKRYDYLVKNAQGEVIERLPVTDFWLEYYTEALDPLSPVYPRLAENMRTSQFERDHALPGHWSRWQDGGYQRWRQDNPQGIEMFQDKALVALRRLAIEFYLHEKPILNKDGYELFKKATKRATTQFVNEKFSRQNQKMTVVKSRRDSGQGHGVYLGANMMNGEVKNDFTWETLRQEVLAHPEEWVYQEFMQEQPLVMMDGRVRSYEIRIITYMENGVPHVFGLLYVRSSKVGEMHNLSGTRDRIHEPEIQSVIPVLFPLRRP